MELVKTRIADDLLFSVHSSQPADAIDRLYASSEAGRLFATHMQQATSEEPEQIINAGEQAIRDHLHSTAVDGASQPEAWQELYRAGFWFICWGIFQRASAWMPSGRILAMHAGVRLQQALTHALLGVLPEDRNWIWNRFQQHENMGARWRENYAGAIAVARAATCLRSICDRVALPVAELDLYYKIDLVIELTEEPHRLLCVQVKYSKDTLPSVEILDVKQEFGNAYLKEAAYIARGMSRFSERFFVDWVPMLVRVSKEALQIYEIEPLPLLRSALQETLQRL